MPIPTIQIKIPSFRANSVYPSVNLPGGQGSTLVNWVKVRTNLTQCSKRRLKVRTGTGGRWRHGPAPSSPSLQEGEIDRTMFCPRMDHLMNRVATAWELS